MINKALCVVAALQLISFTPGYTATLQGAVKEDERILSKHLPALDPTLAPGNIFDKDTATALLKKEIPQNVWYKIPTSLAGSWECREAVI